MKIKTFFGETNGFLAGSTLLTLTSFFIFSTWTSEAEAKSLNAHTAFVLNQRLTSSSQIDIILEFQPPSPERDAQIKEIQEREVKAINRSSNEYFVQQKTIASVPYVGQPLASGDYPCKLCLTSGEKEEGIELTFGFADTNTGIIVNAASINPQITSVIYEVNIDPATPDVFLSVGRSFDATSNFSIFYLPSGFEPFIQATPFDSLGNPIFISGVDNNNVAIGSVVIFTSECVPEPSANLSLLSLVTLGAGATLKRKLKSSKSSEKATTKIS